MATVYQQIPATAFVPDASTGCDWDRLEGTNFPINVLSFAAGAEETAHTLFRAVNYGSGNLTVDIEWYADTATTGTVEYGAAIAVITPNTDTQDIETDAFATENTVTDTHLGTTGQRLHRATITVSNLDSLAADDIVFLRLQRNNAGTMTGAAFVLYVTVSYSDT